MPHHDAPLSPPGLPRVIGWETLLPLALLVLCQLTLAKGSAGPIVGELSDPDGYMRLVRVLDLERGGAWFDPRIERIMPPDGHVQHWTRPLDALLWLGGKLLQPALGFEHGLLVAGTLFSPLCLALAIPVLSWACAPLLGREGRFIACLLLPLQPWVLGYAGLGRPDHHSLLLLLFLLMLGLTVRAVAGAQDKRWAAFAGVVAGLALWVSTEALTFVGAMMIAIGLPWLVGESRAARSGRAFAFAAAMTVLAAVLIERGGHDPLQPDNDRISLVHVSLLALVALFWTIVQRLPADRPRPFIANTGIAAAGAASGAALLLALFPDLQYGILGVVDPVYRELRLERILEIQPLLDPARLARDGSGAILARAILALGPALIALPLLVHHIRTSDSEQRRRWLPVAIPVAIFLPLTFYQIRWGMYAQTLLVIPYALAIVRLAGGLVPAVRAPLGVLVRPLVITIALVWPHAAAQAFPRAERVASADKSCPIRGLASALERHADRPMTIMALADLGPEILYRTPHAVLSIPNHRPQPGFVLIARILGGDDAPQAEESMRDAGVDWILICGATGEATFFDAAAGGEPGSLYRRLLAGDVPGWLRRLPVPEVPEARLFAVRDDARPPRSDDDGSR